jgi:hypothetical protein
MKPKIIGLDGFYRGGADAGKLFLRTIADQKCLDGEFQRYALPWATQASSGNGNDVQLSRNRTFYFGRYGRFRWQS